MNDQESRECMALMDYLARNYPAIAASIFHVPNEGWRSYWTGKKLKRMGVKAGVADYVLPVARCGYPALYLEYKTLIPKGTLTKEQRKWLLHMKQLGNCVAVAYGFEDALTIITSYWNNDNKTIEGIEW